jgi:iron complex transport system ATP-binding protein
MDADSRRQERLNIPAKTAFIGGGNIMLEVQNISINYGVCAVVEGVSFALEAGRIIALLGANGAGKTTLLKALNGGLPIAKGEILLEGKDLKDYSRREVARKIAVIAQETETKFPVSVLDFVLAGRFAHAGAFGWETERDLQIARRCLAQCDLANYEARRMNQLSGGERQRVVLARALATEAPVLLLDEPTANLDLAHQSLMFRLVKERCAGEESAAIVITHDLNLASEFADLVLLLKNGRIAAQGAPAEVLTEGNLGEVFGVRVLLDENPVSRKRRVTTLFN